VPWLRTAFAASESVKWVNREDRARARIPEPEAFFLEAASYESFEIAMGDFVAIMRIQFFQGRLDTHCVKCQRESVFQSQAPTLQMESEKVGMEEVSVEGYSKVNRIGRFAASSTSGAIRHPLYFVVRKEHHACSFRRSHRRERLMMRNLALALLILAYPLSSGLGDEKKPAADDETGLVKVEVKGKLVRQDGRHCVQAKNPVFNQAFLVEILRGEDKDRDLDQHLQNLEGQVVIVRGVLRFTPRRTDGPELAIPINSQTQIQKTKKG
jgi:hypothetical protein